MIKYYISLIVISMLVSAGLYQYSKERRLEDRQKISRNSETLKELVELFDMGKQFMGCWPVEKFENDRTFRDVWQHPFIFISYDKTLGYGRIISYGKDGRAGGDGADADQEVRFDEKKLHSDWMRFEGDKTYCRLHDTLMQPDVLTIVAICTLYSSDYSKARQESFPNALESETAADGVYLAKHQALFCPDCRANREKWLLDHNPSH